MQNFGRENFDDSTCIRQISLDFSTVKVMRYSYGSYIKLFDKLVSILTPTESYTLYLRSNARDTRGHPLKFKQLPTSIDAYKHSFSHQQLRSRIVYHAHVRS